MGSSMRCAVIGCGFFAQNHLNGWRDLAAEGVELVAVCDIDAKKAEEAAKAFGAPRFYADAGALLAQEQLDFVDIVTRMESHLPLVKLACARGVDIILQKPLAPEWKEAREIVETARKAGVRLAIHENFRYQAPMRKLKGVVDSGAIGKLTWARIAFRTGYDIYAVQPYLHQAKRFAILDVGIHMLDLARFFLGDVDRVSCETQRRNPENVSEDTATILLRHRAGAVSVVECTMEARIDPDPFPETLVAIEGDRGSASVGPGLAARVTSDGQTREMHFGSPLLSWTAQPWHTVQESVLRTEEAIIRAWRAGKDPESTGDDNLKTYALVEAAYEAARQGRAVVPELN
jgi:predicted dehydrogenase